jgi:corrinoid protein of di/trimethylamine methyltransferase
MVDGGEYGMATNPEQLHKNLAEALQQGDGEQAEAITKEALAHGMNPLMIIQEIIVPTLTKIGQDFQDFVIFLPELMMAGDAAKRSTALLEEALEASGEETGSLGTVVIGTVENDVHDIGKNIVGTLLNAHGFKVIDLGRDVAPSTFLDTARKERAQIIALSSLMTTTRPAQRSTINLFQEVGERENYQIIVGGGSVKSEWAEEIGADGYAEDAASAVELCKKLVGK